MSFLSVYGTLGAPVPMKEGSVSWTWYWSFVSCDLPCTSHDWHCSCNTTVWPLCQIGFQVFSSLVCLHWKSQLRGQNQDLIKRLQTCEPESEEVSQSAAHTRGWHVEQRLSLMWAVCSCCVCRLEAPPVALTGAHWSNTLGYKYSSPIEALQHSVCIDLVRRAAALFFFSQCLNTSVAERFSVFPSWNPLTPSSVLTRTAMGDFWGDIVSRRVARAMSLVRICSLHIITFRLW